MTHPNTTGDDDMGLVVELIEHDKSEIESIWYPGENAGGYTTQRGFGPMTCDQIVAYGENGHMSAIPFYAVIRDEQIIARVPAWLIEVRYKARVSA